MYDNEQLLGDRSLPSKLEEFLCARKLEWYVCNIWLINISPYSRNKYRLRRKMEFIESRDAVITSDFMGEPRRLLIKNLLAKGGLAINICMLRCQLDKQNPTSCLRGAISTRNLFNGLMKFLLIQCRQDMLTCPSSQTI